MREQLAWLDREIAREGEAMIPLVPIVANPVRPPADPSPNPAVLDAPTYTPNPVAAVADTRRGCVVALVIVLLVIFGALTAIYFLRYRDHPLIFSGAERSPTESSAR